MTPSGLVPFSHLILISADSCKCPTHLATSGNILFMHSMIYITHVPDKETCEPTGTFESYKGEVEKQYGII